ncbi:ribosome production factor 2 [Angomonas deanei]|nr:ribosome production factor 2 [Angomonas deanei]|eukprot:EPY39341.1 ribosome production factor 2 [Angomonas deanei]
MAITKPHCKKLRKKNGFTPFEGREHIEFLGFKNDCSLFCFGSSNKKRPNNLTLGRQFDFHILDMIEVGILAMDPLDMSRCNGVDAGSMGGKPFFVFEGVEFTSDPAMVRLKNLLTDFFHGSNETEINLDGCDRVLHFSLRSSNGTDTVVSPSTDTYTNKPPAEKGNTILCMRHYVVEKPSAASGVSKNIKNISLHEIGPNFDLELRRVSFATPQEFKVASRVPKETLASMRSTAENVTTDGTHSLRGQLHVGTQNVDQLNLRRFKAHRKRTSAEVNEGDEEGAPTKRRRTKSDGEERENVDI